MACYFSTKSVKRTHILRESGKKVIFCFISSEYFKSTSTMYPIWSRSGVTSIVFRRVFPTFSVSPYDKGCVVYNPYILFLTSCVSSRPPRGKIFIHVHLIILLLLHVPFKRWKFSSQMFYNTCFLSSNSDS